MKNDNDIGLLCDTLKKCHIDSCVASFDDTIGSIIGNKIHTAIEGLFDFNLSIRELFGNIESRTIYKYTDIFSLQYMLFSVTIASEPCILFIGPFLTKSISHEELLELGERIGVSPKTQKAFEEYYAGIPIMDENSQLLVLIYTMCERMWGSPSFAIVDVNKTQNLPAFRTVPQGLEGHGVDSVDNALVNMKVMELRYEYENELMRAVTLGQIHKDVLLLSMFSEDVFDNRLSDRIRNAKNYGIIMNTLLRKAAEQGGVHPVYLDKISTEFAFKIEEISTLSDNASLMMDMFRSYCRLVRKFSIQKYSPIVQKAIIAIESDLSADISLSFLAKQQNLSAPYLSSVFKKETGQTISDYIRDKRIQHAMHLLNTTHLQVQTIALHCGIMDVQYFSKIFKKHIGKTPKEYRESIRN